MDSFQIWIKDAIARALRALASRDSIRIETATRGSLITICNWDKYQEESGVNATPMRQESDTSATQDGRQPDLIGEIENKRIISRVTRRTYSFVKWREIYFLVFILWLWLTCSVTTYYIYKEVKKDW